MTGFARSEVHYRDRTFSWEVKSVNARGLEVRLRLPSELERLDPHVRRMGREALARGSCFFNLQQDRHAGSVNYQVNQDALDRVVSAAKRLGEMDGIDPPRADGLLMVRGVVEEVGDTTSADDQASEDEALLSGLSSALAELRAARAEEGARLAAVLLGQLDAMEKLRLEALDLCEQGGEILRARIDESIRALTSTEMDPDRLYQEAVLAATKSDVREEVDRIDSHIRAARDLLNGQGAVGRRLDFLAQELNREANTLCSKAFTNRLSSLGIELKAFVDQFREQVQNVE